VWEAALERASTVVAHAGYLTDGVREHATVVFPLQSYAEQDGTVVHPDGRVQRLRQAIAGQGASRPGWWVLGRLAERLGVDLGVLAGPMASQQLFAAVPFYAGLTLDEIGGRGVRWQEREAVSAWPAAGAAPQAATPEPLPSANGRLRVGTYRSIWWGPEVAASPALKFLRPRTHVELSPADAQRLELRDGEKVDVMSDGVAVGATVAIRAAVPAGSAFVEGNAVAGPLVDIRKDARAHVEDAVRVDLPPEPDEPPVPDVVTDKFPTPGDVREESL
jgi:NADH-quinone oxidoreductase subunit G